MVQDGSDETAFEAAVNERYLKLLDSLPPVRTPVSMPVNTKWTGTGRIREQALSVGPLAARIGLRTADEDLGTAFYIGARRVRSGLFDAEVVSWAAPVAQVFYDPANCNHEIMSSISGRRTLLTSGTKVVRVFDEWVDGSVPTPSPFARQRLVVAPAPVTKPSARRVRPRPSEPAPAVPASPQQRESVEPSVAAVPASSAPLPASRLSEVAKVRHGMRSAESVDFALARPRSDALQSLLATIQPDQYAMVTARPDRALLLQGHPGTGKSVIAIHRAAYLVSPEHDSGGEGRDDTWPQRVLFVGPTTQWREHVEKAVRSLDERQAVTVMAMPELLRALAVVKLGDGGPEPSLQDAARFVHAVVLKALRAAQAEQLLGSAHDPVTAVRTIFDIVRAGRTKKAALDLQMADTREWIATLPPFDQARQLTRYHGMFATIGRLLFAQHPRFDHVIVDEAQDVTGLEWSLLRSLNPAENWTLVGDMNQRRNDYVDSSWQSIADRLYMGSVEPRILERGYRSTQPILDFAKPLLPRTERTAITLQQTGPAVDVQRVRSARELAVAAMTSAVRLCAAHPAGTVGIIAADPAPVRDELVRAGWQRRRETHWEKDGRTVRLLTHVTSRGVEFDGVVVVEPAAFPQNLGRSGPLYTSLTRANRELAVVHLAPLPDALRRHNKAR